jgi:hypothetical protein
MNTAIRPRRAMPFRSMEIMSRNRAVGSRYARVQSYAADTGGVMPMVVEIVGTKYA